MNNRSNKKGTDQQSEVLLKIMHVSLYIIMAGIIIFLIYGQFFTKSYRYFTGKCEVFDNSWSYVGLDGRVITVELP